MSITGLPLIFLAGLLTVGLAAATVLRWGHVWRWRAAVRIGGVLLSEAALVLTVGLVANRAEGFFPSWAALRGNTGTRASSTGPAARRLDGTARSGLLRWRPAAAAAARLRGLPSLLLPAEYAQRPSVTYPVVLDLVAAPAPHPLPDAVALLAAPTTRTAAPTLAALARSLDGDLRVVPHGWAVVAPVADSALAVALVTADPDRFQAIALVGPGSLPASPVPVTRHDTYEQALTWATGQLAAPLAPPVVLPTAGVP